MRPPRQRRSTDRTVYEYTPAACILCAENNCNKKNVVRALLNLCIDINIVSTESVIEFQQNISNKVSHRQHAVDVFVEVFGSYRNWYFDGVSERYQFGAINIAFAYEFESVELVRGPQLIRIASQFSI